MYENFFKGLAVEKGWVQHYTKNSFSGNFFRTKKQATKLLLVTFYWVYLLTPLFSCGIVYARISRKSKIVYQTE